MARIVKVEINGTPADIFDARDFPLKLDFQIEDVTDFTSRRGSGSSQTYRLPGTPLNQKIFGLFDLYSTAPIDNIKTTLPCVISVDDVPILTGKVVLIETVTSSYQAGRRGIDFEVAFIAENADWFNDLQGKTLRDIDWSDLDHELTAANVESGWGFAGFGGGRDFGYNLIKWKDWPNVNYLTHVDFTPFLFAPEIITRAFNSIGYTIDSTFLGSVPILNCMLPVPLREYGSEFFENETNMRATKTTSVSVATPPFTTLLVYDDEATPPNQDPGGNYNNVTGIYTVPYTGVYNVKATVQINNIVATTNSFGLALLLNGVTLIPFPVPFFTIVNGDFMEVDQTILFNQGDTIEIALGSGATVVSFDADGGELEIQMQEFIWTLNDSDVFFNYLVPNSSLLGYIKGITEMFNLYIYADSAAKVVRIESRDRFIDGAVDISQEIDLNKRGAKRFITSNKDFRYQYLEDSNDETVVSLNSVETIPIYATEYGLSDPNASGRRVITNSFFSATIHIKDSSIAGFAGADTPPQIPLIWPENYNEIPFGVQTDYDFLPRILYHQGIIGAPVGVEPSTEGTISLNVNNPAHRNRWPKCFMVDYDVSGRPNLSYSNEIVAFGVEENGLVRRYYLNQLASVNNGVQRDEWWIAKITDIIAEEFRNHILIRGQRYVLQKIAGYTPNKQDSTKIILLEDICATQDDEDRITRTTKKGLITD